MPNELRDPVTGVLLPATTTDPAVIHEKGRREYGRAHEITGTWIQENFCHLSALGPMVFDVIMIQHKLTRLLLDPERRDHLDDLIGYAKLALSLQEKVP